MPNPSIPEMTPKSASPNIVEWILVVLVLVMIVGLGYVYFALTQLSQSVASTNAEVMMMKSELTAQKRAMAMEEEKMEPIATRWVSYELWDVPFEYPESFSVILVSDDDTDGQRNAVITSKPGRLMQSSGGPGLVGDQWFTSGYEMSLQKFFEGDIDAAGWALVPTGNPLVQKKTTPCEEAGCPSAEYVLTVSGRQYHVLVNYTSDYPEGEEITEQIIQSLGR